MKKILIFLLLTFFTSAFAFAQDTKIATSEHAVVAHKEDPQPSATFDFTLKETSKIMNLFGVNRESFGNSEFFGVSIYSWAVCGILLLLYIIFGFVFIKIAINLIIKILKTKKLEKLEYLIANMRIPMAVLIVTFAVYQSFQGIIVELNWVSSYEKVFVVLLNLSMCWLLLRIYDNSVNMFKIKTARKSGYRELIPFFANAIRWILIVFVLMHIIKRLGGDIDGIILSLGIGGAALAFASKDTIANFFGSMSLIMDSPFKLSDYIKVKDKLEGTVESIGIRSTRIRNSDQTLSILPNSYLANEYIVNVSNRTKRKVTTVLGLSYGTSCEQIESIMSEITSTLGADSRIDKDSVLVCFENFDPSSLRLNVIYLSAETETRKHYRLVSDINCVFMRIVEKNGSSFAFPTQSIYLEKK